METIDKDGFSLIIQKNGRTLGFSKNSGIGIIKKDGFFFKDFLNLGELLPYEDWRLSPEQRADDLAKRLSLRQIAGLMLYSNHQTIPATSYDISTYGGKKFEDSGADVSDISDNQKRFITEDELRHILIITIASPLAAAKWNNKVQAYTEGIGFGIPVNTSSDPRHSARADAEFNAGGGKKLSMWPSQLGLAATFDPILVERFGVIASKEYRAMGFCTALSPQADICTDPRWYRCHGTFGSDPCLAADLTRAYCNGFQTSYDDNELSNGWGTDSVNVMVKHWPGGGPCESGRDAHYGCGKYAVYPSGNFETHKIPFIEGAFQLNGKTKMASAVMPYYTIPFNQTTENTANAFNAEIITSQLRNNCAFDGVVCTDWLVTADEIHPGVHSGKPWGVESLTVSERHYKALKAGVDQFGGNNNILPVLDAFNMWKEEFGEESMQNRIRLSAKRMLLNFFRVGLFDNPYIDTNSTVTGIPEYINMGYDAQVKSVVMLKNKNSVLPIKPHKKVYIPDRNIPEHKNFWGATVEGRTFCPVSNSIINKYYEKVDNPDCADFAIVFMDSPNSVIGYNDIDADNGGNGYVPLSLQYRRYTANNARENSIAGGDPYESFINRSYRGKSTTSINEKDLDILEDTRNKMVGKSIIACINISNPFVVSELEPLVDAILFTFDIQTDAVLDIISGKNEPSGLLPFQIPMNMDEIEQHCEDAVHDMKCYIDESNNCYDFAFGLNWSGTINDYRVKKYRK